MEENTKPADTRTRILDAAEGLFADKGFQSVSLREITTAAGANLAAVNYHFGSRDALVFEVLTRILGPINEQRLASLDKAQTEFGDEPVPIERILDALFRPVIDLVKEGSHSSSMLLKLAGRCLAETEAHSPEVLMKLFREVAERFVAASVRSLPHLDEEDIHWRFHMAFGAFLHTLTKGSQLMLFSNGKIKSVDPDMAMEQTLRFFTAGMAAPPVESRPSRKTTVLFGLAAACLLSMSSCASVSPADSKGFAHVEVPANWVAGKSYRPAHFPDTFWVDHFKSKALSSYIKHVLENNRDIKAAEARLQIALANARITGADLYPGIDANFGGQRSKQNFIGFPFGPGGQQQVISNQNNQFGLSLDLSWEIDLWGRIRAAESSSIAEFEASQFDRAAAELSLTGQAVKAWLALAEAKNQVLLAGATVSVFLETEEAIRSRFERGIDEGGGSLASELLLAQSDTATARDSLAARQELVGRTSRQLEVLAGHYPAGFVGKNAQLPTFPSPMPIDLPATLLDRRPDLAAAERRIAAADQGLLEAKRALLPSISLTGSAGTSTEQIEDILDANFSVWSIAGSLAQPILQGGRLRANIRKNEAEMMLAAAEFEQATLTAFSEVENALAAEKFFVTRINALSEAADLAEQAYHRARADYAEGSGQLLTILQAQQTTFARKSELLAVQRQRLENRVDLYLALGGSFRPYEPPPHKEAPDT